MAEKTKLALVAALRKQLTKKPLSKVTISDITSDAGVNRMTFYYHFHDIYELVEWAFRNQIFAATFEKTYTTDNWQEGALEVLNILLENKSFVMNVYHSLSREQIETNLLSGIRETVVLPLVEQLNAAGIPQEDQTFIIYFYMYGCLGSMLEWVDHDMKESPTLIVDHFVRLIKSGLGGLLENYLES